MARKFVKGRDTASQIDSIDKVLQQFQRRLGTKVIGVLPPIPLLFSCAKPMADGTIFAAICPVGGMLRNACVYIDKMTGKNIELRFEITSEGVTKSDSRTFTKPVIKITLDEVIFSGTILRLIAVDPNSVENVLVGIELLPQHSEYVKESYLQEELEAIQTDQSVELSQVLNA